MNNSLWHWLLWRLAQRVLLLSLCSAVQSVCLPRRPPCSHAIVHSSLSNHFPLQTSRWNPNVPAWTFKQRHAFIFIHLIFKLHLHPLKITSILCYKHKATSISCSNSYEPLYAPAIIPQHILSVQRRCSILSRSSLTLSAPRYLLTTIHHASSFPLPPTRDPGHDPTRRLPRTFDRPLRCGLHVVAGFLRTQEFQVVGYHQRWPALPLTIPDTPTPRLRQTHMVSNISSQFQPQDFKQNQEVRKTQSNTPYRQSVYILRLWTLGHHLSMEPRESNHSWAKCIRIWWLYWYAAARSYLWTGSCCVQGP